MTKEEDKKPDKEQEKAKPTLVDEANKAAERVEAANKKTEELLERQEKAVNEGILAGRADAGDSGPKKETEDEKYKREAKVRYEGTGMDPTEE